MTVTAPATIAVRKTVTVKAPQAIAFEVFTARIETWWPMATHKIGQAECAAVVIEPRIGGRWFERGVDGVECPWGRVLAWEPHARVLLSWQLNSQWAFDTSLHTEVEVTFRALDAGSTEVTLEHRGLEAYGDAAVAMQAAFTSPNGWSGMLDHYAAVAAQRAG